MERKYPKRSKKIVGRNYSISYELIVDHKLAT